MKKISFFSIFTIFSISLLFIGASNDVFAIGGIEYEPTQPNALASYNSDTNEIQVSWDFDELPDNTTCLLKGDMYYFDDLNANPNGVRGVNYELITGFMPLYYSTVSSNPVTLVDGGKTAEVISCTGDMRIDIDTIMNHSQNVNNYPDLQIFLTFYLPNDDGSFNSSSDHRIDEVFVSYTPTNTWDTDFQAYACGGQIGSTLSIDQSGIYGNNGDNCDGDDFKYVSLESNDWIDIGMKGSGLHGETTTGAHDPSSFPLLIQVIDPLAQTPTKNKSGGCSGDCTDPTFFKNENGKEIVENGFELKGKATDVVDYHVPWELITLNTDQTYNMKLKVYENNALKWIGVYFGVPEIGDSLNDAESEVIFHLNYDKHIEEITTVDRHTLVDILSYRISQVDCGYADSQCYLLNFDFVFRDKQKNNVVAIQAVDMARNSAVHYINDGIDIVGDSMNDPLHSNVSVSQGGAFYPQRAGTVELTLVDYKTDMWQDKYGYMWSVNNYGFYIIDTVSMPLQEPDVMWQAMTRMNSNFADMIIYEQDRAMLVYPSEEAFADFKESFSYELPKTKAQQQTELDKRIADEIKRITSLTKDYTLQQDLYIEDSDNHWIYFGDLTAAELEYLIQEKRE